MLPQVTLQHLKLAWLLTPEEEKRRNPTPEHGRLCRFLIHSYLMCPFIRQVLSSVSLLQFNKCLRFIPKRDFFWRLSDKGQPCPWVSLPGMDKVCLLLEWNSVISSLNLSESVKEFLNDFPPSLYPCLPHPHCVVWKLSDIFWSTLWANDLF